MLRIAATVPWESIATTCGTRGPDLTEGDLVLYRIVQELDEATSESVRWVGFIFASVAPAIMPNGEWEQLAKYPFDDEPVVEQDHPAPTRERIISESGHYSVNLPANWGRLPRKVGDDADLVVECFAPGCTGVFLNITASFRSDLIDLPLETMMLYYQRHYADQVASAPRAPDKYKVLKHGAHRLGSYAAYHQTIAMFPEPEQRLIAYKWETFDKGYAYTVTIHAHAETADAALKAEQPLLDSFRFHHPAEC